MLLQLRLENTFPRMANVNEVELEPTYCSSIPLLYCSVSIKLRTIVKNSHN